MAKIDELIELVKRDAVRFGDFTLASGKKSDIYVDLRKVTLSAKGASLIGSLIYDIIQHKKVDAIGGMTMGADPIAVCASVAAFEKGYEMDAFLVRKERKGHGTQNWIEGPVKAGDRVVVVEDVITTGGSTLQALDRIEEGGLVVDSVIAIFDREEGGKAAIEERGYKVHVIISRKDL